MIGHKKAIASMIMGFGIMCSEEIFPTKRMIHRPTKKPLDKEQQQEKILKAKEKRERKRLKREKLNG